MRGRQEREGVGRVGGQLPEDFQTWEEGLLGYTRVYYSIPVYTKVYKKILEYTGEW